MSHGGEGSGRRGRGSVALVERALGELEVNMGVCMRENVSLATVSREELTGSVLQLLFL